MKADNHPQWTVRDYRNHDRAPRMAKGVEVLINALSGGPLSWAEAINAITSTGLSYSTARTIVYKGISAGFLARTGSYTRTLEGFGAAQGIVATDSRAVALIHWPAAPASVPVARVDTPEHFPY